MKRQRAGCLLAWLLAGMAAMAGGLLLVDRALAAVEARVGDALYLAVGGALAASLVLVAVGGALALVRWLAHRARLVYADRHTALYPQVRVERNRYLDLNEPRAQSLACLAAASRQRPTAAMVGRVLDVPAALPAAPAAQIATPGERYPTRVEVYSAPLPAVLALPIGIDGRGRPVALPLRGLGNVVIGGLPNCGKSELLASMAAGLLRQDATGERQQLAVIDMKLVSFGNLPPLAALRWPVATDLDAAHEVIAAVRAECQRRYELLRDAGARTLDEYEQRAGETLPYLTVLVDEIADLTCDDDRVRAQRFLSSALDVARKGRAAGLALVLATQRPSVDVLPSSLRNLAGAAVAFRVSRNHDSMAVLGEPGAETLPALPGRCLVKRAETIECQAYAAGLEGGRFDAFVASLPQTGIAAPAWPRSTAIPPVILADTGTSAGIPLFSIDDRTTYTAEQITHIRGLYAHLGSIKAVERKLYGQDGGYWFYRIKEALE